MGRYACRRRAPHGQPHRVAGRGATADQRREEGEDGDAVADRVGRHKKIVIAVDADRAAPDDLPVGDQRHAWPAAPVGAMPDTTCGAVPDGNCDRR